MSDRSDSTTGDKTKAFLQSPAPDGWEHFVEHYGRTIHRWSRLHWHLGGEEADDLTQIVIVKLFEKMRDRSTPLWDPAKGRFHAWLKTVTRHAWLDAKEVRKRQLGSGGTSVLALLENDTVCEDFTELIALRELLQVARQRAQARVSSTVWEAYRLRKVEDLPAKEVATRMTLEPETIDNYTSRVVTILKEELDALA